MTVARDRMLSEPLTGCVGLRILTNAPDLTPVETVARYKSLADIERDAVP